MKNLLLATFITSSIVATAQVQNKDVHKFGAYINRSEVRHEVRIPKIDGMVPLKCDLHSHTVFSDGAVMPSIRVKEAWQHGLDAIAITDHIEYRPHKKFVLGDLNEANKLAQKAAKDRGIIVVEGTEITRRKPLGHLNALFIKDATKMDVKDPLEAIDEAISQGAFILWNHPGWPDDESKLYSVHKKLIKESKIHGIEVFNQYEYYPASFDWCNDYNLAYVGNSDIHTLTSINFGMDAIRPMTIAFATEKSSDALKEALFAKRTVALFNGEIAGREELVKKLVKASLCVTNVGGDKIEVYNNSDISYNMTFDDTVYIFPASKTVRITMPKKGSFVVNNCHVGTGDKLEVDAEELFSID